MGREYTEAQKRASMNYQKKKAQIKFTISKEQAERYKQHAESNNISLTQLIVKLIEKDIKDTNK